MSNRRLHLFIFEGKSSEFKIVQKLENNFFGRSIGIKCVFDAEVYQLYKKMKDAEDFPLDMVNLLKERSETNKKELNDYNRDSFESVYLFFDYDAHSSLADDDKLKKMLAFFNNETEHGMLYISYPMVEAIRHFNSEENFKDCIVKCKGRNCELLDECKDKDVCLSEPHYKTFVGNNYPQMSNINKLTFGLWAILIRAHLKKMNYIVGDDYSFPLECSSQLTIFQKQLEKYIKQDCPKVAVLSAFPLFVLDYYGCEKLKDILGKDGLSEDVKPHVEK